MRVLDVFSLSLVLALGACFVDVPSEEDGPFACESDGDCTDGYHCGVATDGGRFCVPEGGASCASDADCAGAGVGFICVRASATERQCAHRCTQESECAQNEACVMTWTFSGGAIKACKPCCPNGPPNCGACVSPATCVPGQTVARNYDEANAICQ